MNKRLFFIFILLITSYLSNAQFYLGHQMSFGKNRIQYRNFVWRYLRYPQFDVYYYEGGKPIGYFVAKYANEQLPQIQRILDYDLKKRIIFITYNNLREFKQSNIGLFTGNVNVELAATTQIVNNKIIVFYQDSHEKLRYQIRRAIALMLIREMLFGKGFTAKFYSANPMSIPDWFTYGLAEYIANPTNTDYDNITRDFILHSSYIKITRVHSPYDKILGYSFWKFITDNYGQDVIPNIIYFARVSKNLSNAFYYVLGVKLNQLNRQWFNFYKDKYLNQIQNRQPIDSAFILKHFKKRYVYQQVRFSPANGKLAYVINDHGRYKVVLYDPQKHRRKVIFRQGQHLDQITDFSYPTLAWSPDGTTLAFITEEHGSPYINYYNVEKHKLHKAALGDLTKIYSFNYSQNGRFIVLSGQKNGYIDIYVYNLSTGILQRITFDPYDDLYPAFIDKSRKIIFSSNRGSDTLLTRVFRVEQKDSIERTFDLFIYDFQHHRRTLKRLTNTRYSNELQAFEINRGHYTFLSDTIGITNRMAIYYDSTIASIDTAIHYRYFTRTFPVTNYYTSILQQDFSPRNFQVADDKFWQKRYVLSNYRQNFTPNSRIIQNFKPTDLRIEQIRRFSMQDQMRIMQYRQKEREKAVADSIARVMQQYKYHLRDTFVDINHYVFEIERDTAFRTFYNYQLQQKQLKAQRKLWGRPSVYQPTFYLTKLNMSFDYQQLVQSYQPFTGGTFVFSPGMNLFTVVQVNELFENYRIFGGFRLNSDLRSVEYLASFEDLSKRLDKQILFHRNVTYANLGFVGYNYTMTKTTTNELLFSLRYPFNQVASLRATVLGRYDRKIYLATDNGVYTKPGSSNFFASTKLEFIYDNTRQLSLNLYDGIRSKVFLEGYRQIGSNKYWTAITGIDFRFYKNLWRNMIFAWRFAASTNTGSGKLIYYLGGVDYWYVLSLNPLQTGNQMFYQDVNINYDNNYIFQAVATPMRGFKQNIRNGTTFMLMNTEIRMPVFQMLFDSPVSSQFLHNFQVVGFFDVGSAWCGKSPSDSCNVYNRYYVHYPPVTMVVDIERPPVVEGFGFGLRSKLLGYFVRLDFAWGVEASYIHPMQFYLSLAYDF